MFAQLSLGSLISVECKKWAVDDLLVLTEGSVLTTRMSSIAESLISDYISSIPTNDEKVMRLLKQLALQNKIQGRYFHYLNLISKVKTLSNEEDLSFLIELMEKELKEDLSTAVMILKFFKGPLQPSKTSITFYLNLLNLLKEQKKYSELCNALALNPFTKDTHASLNSFVSVTLMEILGVTYKK